MGALTLTAECVACHHRETFDPPPNDVPMCSKCFSPMVTVSVEAEARQVADSLFERAFGRKP